MARYKIYTFLGFFIVTLLTVIVCGILRGNLEHTSFFFFSSFFVMNGTHEFCHYRQEKNSTPANRKKMKIRTATLFLWALTLFFIGVMHVSGNLSFPDFIFIDGWNNGYVMATRIAWFLSLSIGVFLQMKYGIKEEQKTFPQNSKGTLKEKNGHEPYWSIPFRVLLFPVLFVPIIVLISDYFGISTIREIVVYILQTYNQ